MSNPLDPAPAHAGADAPVETAADPAASPGVTDLAAVRAELDGIDDALHDLLRRRAAMVARLAAARIKSGAALRPGREAAILRRLLGRHDGPLPRQAVARIWRELLAATVGMQGGFVVAVCDTDPAAAYTQAAREQFGALTPLHVHRSPAQAMAEVSTGSAAAAVLPVPAEDEAPRDAWWTALLQKDEPRIYIVARLPFWTPRPEGAPRVPALVVSAVPPDASGDDRSLLGFEVSGDVSRARLAGALVTAGLTLDGVILRRDPAAGIGHALVDVAGLVGDDDPRLAALAPVLRRPVVLGAYAVPVDG